MVHLSIEYKRTGEIIIPQEPTLFEYEVPASFPIDDYLNIHQPPKDQCVLKGVGFNFTCREKEDYETFYRKLESSMNEYVLRSKITML